MWFFLGLLLLGGADSRETISSPTLRKVLLDMQREDQDSIHALMASRPSDPGDAKIRQLGRKVHQRNSGLIRAIVTEYGWPGRSLVGKDGAHAAWLIVQHSDEDPAFQRRCLTLLEDAFHRGEADALEVAYLTDRVLVNEGKQQMYGTQGAGVTSRIEEARIDRNRSALGLEPWRSYVEKLRHPYPTPTH
jgi:hypothetical protein